MIKKSLSMIGICSLFSTMIYGENSQIQKKIISVQLDRNSKKAHEQLDLLKNMDVLGVNFKTNQADVYATETEVQELKKAHLSVFTKVGQEDALANAVGDYLNPTQVRSAMTVLNQKFPTLTRLFEFGKTTKNLPMMALEISSQTGDSKRPTVLFNGMHHAREVMTTEVVMHIADVLTDQYGKDPEITYWLDNYRIILVPQVNPDGNTLVHNGQTMWRKNAYTLNSAVVGVDLNRNYPAYWNYCQGSSGSSSNEAYRGVSPASEPETKAMMNLVSEFKPVAEISYHSYSELIIYPYGCSNVSNPSKDLFRQIAFNMKAAIRDDSNQLNTYSVGTAPELLYNVDGGDLDWMWKEKGVLGFTIEVNASNFMPNYKQWRDVTAQRQEGGWKTILRQMQKSGFHGLVQSNSPQQITYSLKKALAGNFVAFDSDDVTRKFALKSQDGLMYQLTEPGDYQISFFKDGLALKTINVHIENQNIDLGTIDL